MEKRESPLASAELWKTMFRVAIMEFVESKTQVKALYKYFRKLLRLKPPACKYAPWHDDMETLYGYADVFMEIYERGKFERLNT